MLDIVVRGKGVTQVASKSKWKEQRRALGPQELEARVHQALREGRTQQALELARNLFKQDRTPASLKLVQQATLARARQLSDTGNARDAGTLLSNAVDLGGAEFLREVAAEMARCGEVRQATKLVEQSDDPELRKRIAIQAADHAIRQGKAGRSLLPASDQPQFDLVLTAFQALEAGRDDEVKYALQGIGLQSAFLEWKLLIRGMLAYHQNDDPRAIENWQRLDSERLPARLAAPYRALIDKAFLQAQPPASQDALRAAADRLQGTGLMPSLRKLRTLLADVEQLPAAFRLAESVYLNLKQSHAALAPRLAACFYWAVIDHGRPEDKQRYLRIFGPPPDDPHCLRLECLALEECGNDEHAHLAWQEYEKWMASDPVWGSTELRQRARALIWCRLGENADRIVEPSQLLPPFLRKRLKKPKLDPPAEKCYRQSLKLAPDLLEAHEALFRHFQQDKKNVAKAIKAGNDLLEHFPQHGPTLEALGHLCIAEKEFAKALDYYQRALAVNPLERRYRDRIGLVHLAQARELALGKRFEEARRSYQSALDVSEPGERYCVLAKLAACELKAGNGERGDELIAEANAQGRHAAAVSYHLVIEASRLKLPKAVKDRLSRAFSERLAQAPTADTAVVLLDIAAAHRKSDVEYHGQKTHERKVLAYLNLSTELPWTEEQLEKLCSALLEVQTGRVFDRFVRRGRMAHPQNPVFVIRQAEGLLAAERHTWQIRPLLQRARELARALPPGERQTRLLEEIHELQDLAKEGDMPMGFPGAGMFERMFDAFGGFSAEDDDDDWEDL